MPRPRPLENLASARYNSSEYQILTPRTPHSRAGRAEEGVTEIELAQEFNDPAQNDYQTESELQNVPLLASSSRDSFNFTAQKKYVEKKPKKFFLTRNFAIKGLRQLPLILGICLCGILLTLLVMSLKQPDVLHRVVGVPSPSPSPSTIPAPAQPAPPSPLTLSYENYTTFPLHSSEYVAECSKLDVGYLAHGDYWDPPFKGTVDVVHHDDNHDYHLPEGELTTVCKSTITYMLDGEVGLAADLALMAQAAALARERGRTFLVDDTYWNRGKWTDHFQDVRARQPGPEPGCRAPPKNELVACPRAARHWVINSRTSRFHFGDAFSNHYENPYAHNLNRMKPMYEAAAESFKTTIRPNAKNAALIRSARAELSRILGPHSQYLAVHIRRGDRRAASYEYPGKYVPLQDFSTAAIESWGIHHNESDSQTKPMLYIASDSPSVANEFADLYGGPTTSLFKSNNHELSALASSREYRQKEFNALGDEERVNATRGMIIDFALISGMWAWDGEVTPEGIVCTLSSNICRLSAVGLGWERAFGNVDQMGYIDNKNKRWIDVDEKGRVMPVWRAFETF